MHFTVISMQPEQNDAGATRYCVIVYMLIISFHACRIAAHPDKCYTRQY